MLSQDFTSFSNRLRKMNKHFAKWARRQGITCYRVYDADLSDFPLQIDRYEEAVYVAEFSKNNKDEAEDEQQYRLWRAAVRQIIAEVLGVEEALIFFRQRQRQSGTNQYEKVHDAGRERVISENGLQFIVNLRDYLDTGLFLDHRQTRQRARELSEGKDCLNLFAYTGAFSVYMAAGGARSTTTIDLSNTYTDWTKRNMALNGFEGEQHRMECADVLRYLQDVQKAQFDLIILDPPTFSNSKKMLGILDVQRDHAWMIRQCLKLLRPKGLVLFSTNFRKFTLNEDNFQAASVKEITKQTMPPDFRNGKVHRCWEILQV